MANLPAFDPRVMGFDPRMTNFNPRRLGCYILGETVGEGSYGKVKFASHEQEGDMVAIKIISRQMAKKRHKGINIFREIKILQLIKHPHITQVYEVISTVTDYFIVMDFAFGGDLHKYMKENSYITEQTARHFFQQIISGLDYCHRHLIVHRDLKPENILLDEYQENVTIADFGVSRMMADGKLLSTFCGSPYYMAPEIFDKGLYGPAVDIWSCGMILYTLLCNANPFQSACPETFIQNMKTGVFIIPEYLTDEVVSLLHQLLKVDPMERATTTTIRESEWFQEDLPHILFPEASDYEDAFVKDEIMHEISKKLGVERAGVEKAVLGRNPQNPLYRAYKILLDNLRLFDRAGHEYEKFYLTPPPPGAFSLSGSRHPAPIPEMNPFHTLHPFLNDSDKTERIELHMGFHFTDRKPTELMHTIYQIMAVLEYEWIVIDYWNVRVRRKNPVTSRYSLLSLQMYEMEDNSCLLDCMSVTKSRNPLITSRSNCGKPTDPSQSKSQQVIDPVNTGKNQEDPSQSQQVIDPVNTGKSQEDPSQSQQVIDPVNTGKNQEDPSQSQQVIDPVNTGKSQEDPSQSQQVIDPVNTGKNQEDPSQSQQVIDPVNTGKNQEDPSQSQQVIDPVNTGKSQKELRQPHDILEFFEMCANLYKILYKI